MSEKNIAKNNLQINNILALRLKSEELVSIYFN